jgi:hypothetical protein
MAENLSDGLLRFFGGLGAATLFVGAYIWSRKNEKAKKQKQVEVSKKWQYSMNRWNQLYYCYRDDCIYNPNENRAYPVAALNDVIDWHPEPVPFWRKLIGF